MTDGPDDIVGFDTEKLCPDCGAELLVRQLDRLDCPACAWTESNDDGGEMETYDGDGFLGRPNNWTSMEEASESRYSVDAPHWGLYDLPNKLAFATFVGLGWVGLLTVTSPTAITVFQLLGGLGTLLWLGGLLLSGYLAIWTPLLLVYTTWRYEPAEVNDDD